VDRNLGEALGQVFVAKTFTPETKARTLAMTKEIELAMEKDLTTLAWMGPETRQQALTKLHAIVNKSAIPTSGATIARSRSGPTTSRATYCAPRYSNTGASWPRSASRSTAASG